MAKCNQLTFLPFKGLNDNVGLSSLSTAVLITIGDNLKIIISVMVIIAMPYTKTWLLPQNAECLQNDSYKSL